MGLKRAFIRARDRYVVRQVRRAKLPDFPAGEARRYEVVFSGRVQKVGFRLETAELAARLGLTGFCRNLENGAVLAQLQGTEERIRFLMDFMESLRRIKITEKAVTAMAVIPAEQGFSQC